MGKQKKGFNWRARQQGGTLETEPVARLRKKVKVAGLDQEAAAYQALVTRSATHSPSPRRS